LQYPITFCAVSTAGHGWTANYLTSVISTPTTFCTCVIMRYAAASTGSAVCTARGSWRLGPTLDTLATESFYRHLHACSTVASDGSKEKHCQPLKISSRILASHSAEVKQPDLDFCLNLSWLCVSAATEAAPCLLLKSASGGGGSGADLLLSNGPGTDCGACPDQDYMCSAVMHCPADVRHLLRSCTTHEVR
jgi:hypothetical protein